MTPPTIVCDAARILDVPTRDIAQAFVHEHGLVAVTNAGVQYIDVDPATPDGDGKTGLMFLAKPDPERTYAFPVFVPVDEDDATPVPADGETTGEATGDGSGEALPAIEAPPLAGPGSGLKAWAAYAEQLGIPADQLDGLKRDDVVALVAELGPAADATPVPADGETTGGTDG